MKFSEILHWITAISGIIGFLALAGAWIAGNETFFGFTQEHLFSDAISLLLVSVSAGIGTLIHQNLEK